MHDRRPLSLKNVNASVRSIVLWFAEELGVKLNPFVMEDVNTFILVNGLKKKKTYAVKADPNILNYTVWNSEKGKSANQLLQGALQKVLYINTMKWNNNNNNNSNNCNKIIYKSKKIKKYDNNNNTGKLIHPKENIQY